MPEIPERLMALGAPAAEAPATPIEDVMFPDLPAGIAALTPFGGEVNEKLVKAKMRATALLALKLQGYNRHEIGRMLGMTANAVRVALWRARQAGKLNDLRAILEHDSATLAVESLNFHLKKKDKELTVETLKGLGHFKSYNNNKNEGAPGVTGLPQLNVTIINAPNAGTQQIVSTGVGVAREDDPPAV